MMMVHRVKFLLSRFFLKPEIQDIKVCEIEGQLYHVHLLYENEQEVAHHVFNWFTDFKGNRGYFTGRCVLWAGSLISSIDN